MKEKTYIFGHQNPDTDSICSSIAYADLKNKLHEPAQAYRLGELSNETKFVLEYFHVETPPILHTVKPQVKDLDYYEPLSMRKEEALYKVWHAVKSQGSRIVPITNEQNILEGVISLGDVTKLYMENSDEDIIKQYPIRFSNLIDVLQGEIVHGTYQEEFIYGSIFLASTSDEKQTYEKKDILIAPNLERYYKFAFESNCGCVILTNGIEPVISKNSTVCIVKTDLSIFKVVNLLNQAIDIGSVMEKKHLETFHLNDYLRDVMETVRQSSHRNFPIVDEQKALQGILSRRHLIHVKRKKVILIDHNEKSQSVDGLSEAEIVEIIDHHRIADIDTSVPVYVRAEPLGSSASLVYKLYKEHKVPVEKNIAGILLSAILSDTLVFTSPTCTETDKQFAEELSVLAGVNIAQYASAMFQAGTDLSNYTDKEILDLDRKEFNFEPFKISVSQINTMDLQSFEKKLEPMLEEMKSLEQNKGYDLVILMITDLMLGGSELIFYGKAERLKSNAFNISKSQNRVFIPDMVSRKKQLLPKLSTAAQLL